MATLANTQQPSLGTCTVMMEESQVDTMCSCRKYWQACCQKGFGKGLRALGLLDPTLYSIWEWRVGKVIKYDISTYISMPIINLEVYRGESTALRSLKKKSLPSMWIYKKSLIVFMKMLPNIALKRKFSVCKLLHFYTLNFRNWI